MMKWFRYSRGFALALSLGGASFVLTEGAVAELSNEEHFSHDNDRAEHARARGEIRPLEDIMPLVRDRITGEIAHIELERERGSWIYEFKVIDHAGRLLEVKIDAKTGAIVEIGGE